MKKAIALFICLGGLVLAVEAATEWRVKPYGLLDMRNTLSVKVRAGTFCEPEVVYRSSTGKIGYHYVTITDAFGSKAKALVECESHTVADPVPPPVPAPPLVKPLVSENFDDFSYADTGWGVWLQKGNCNTGTTLGLNAQSAYSGAAGLDIYYHMSNDPNAQGDCQLHQDNNTSLIKNISPGLDHYFVRGYFRFPFDTATLCQNPMVQRKLLYFKPVGWGSGRWAHLLTSWPWTDCTTNGYNVSVGYGSVGGTYQYWGNGSPGFINPTANNHLYVNTWYYIEAEVQYGTYGNDTLRVWLAPAGSPPTLIFERTDLTLRSSTDAAAGVLFGKLEVGRQVDVNRSSFSQGVDEHRYWDEIVIDTKRIGPL